jgi:2-iminobutanoate/2-iminopropanoate deaminase
MVLTVVEAAEGQPATGFAQAVAVVGAQRLLFISGQVPATPGWDVPPAFEDQARLAWRNVLAQVKAADMTPDHLVRVTIYLSDRANIAAHRIAFDEALGGRLVAVTTVIATLLNEAWQIEIDAIAAA